ncbi:MAG: DUF3098 domain-containing protein [Prevotella sp.]|nr:DUF3098 domain-containing protein [Prevotella sp.]
MKNLSISRCIIIVACILIMVGYLLMAGPGSTEHSFNPEIFSTRRLVIAPILCLAGYLLIVFGILCSQRSIKGTASETNKTYS